MIDFGSKSKANLRPREHEHYFELCALATSGSLTDQEWAELTAHLPECKECKELVQKYRELTKTGMSFLTPEVSAGDFPAQKSWSPEVAKQDLLARLARGETAGQYHLRARLRESHGNNRFWQYLPGPRMQAFLAYAAGIALIATSLATAYRVGHSRGQEVVRTEIQSSSSEVASLRGQLDGLMQERTSLHQRLQAQDEQVASLSRDVQRQVAEVAKWKALAGDTKQSAQQQTSEIAKLRGENSSIVVERDAISQKLQDTEVALASTQKRLDALREERSGQLARLAALETHIETFSTRQKETDQTIRQQQAFLAADRDIRELMGARELYIADVFDVDDNGRTRKPFGRVFYTRGKSLIFYAFDLDHQPGLRKASAFQAWGRRGPADKQPLNLGILYLDNEANRRWVLKFDDPKALTQIDAVFVTVEPHGGSQKPSGKQLLFASLRTPPNHP